MDRYKKSTASHGGELKDTDKNIKYDTIVKVIGIINRAGFSKVSLVTVQ